MSELDIKRINLMMGNICNFRCRHCIQNGSVKSQEKIDIDESVINYIKHLASLRPNFMGKLTVCFWGGEPLIYFHTIKDVVKKLGDTVSYSIVTNGSLLNAVIIDFLNENNISLVLSNDGEDTEKVRGFNMLENDEFISLFKQVKNRAVDVCVSAYSQDYFKVWDYIERKLGKDITIYNEPLVVSWDMPKDMYAFDFEAYKETMNKVVENAYQGLLNKEITREYELIDNQVRRILRNIEGKEKRKVACSQMEYMISVDLSGNVYACHNGCDKLGTVDDSFESLQSSYYKLLLNKPLADCQMCPYVNLCGYGCLNSYESEGKSACCTMKKIFIDSCIDFVSKLSGVFEPVDLEDSYDCD